MYELCFFKSLSGYWGDQVHYGFFLLSHFFQLSVFPSTTHNIMTLAVAFRVAISNIQQVLIPFVGIRHVRNPLLLLVIVNESSAHLF